jgi:hypothetical protein
MVYRVDPLSTFRPLHKELPYDDELLGYTVRFTQAHVGKLFTIKRRFSAKIDPDVGSAYELFNGELTGTLYAGSRVEILACTKDKDPNETPDPDIGTDELRVVGSWSLPDGADSGPKTQRFNALELGTENGKLFILALGIRVVACADASRAKLKLLKYTVK